MPGTAVCGRVFASELDGTNNVPLEGVTITVDGAEATMRALTDDMGNFRLDPAPAGRFFVHVDGRTATGVPAGDYYPFVGKPWSSVPGEETNVGEVYLPRVIDGTLQSVSMTVETMVELPQSVIDDNPLLAGTELRVPPDSLFADDNRRGGMVGIAPVAPDRLPGALPDGLNLPLVLTVQTDGATNFDTPAPICFPNLPDPETMQPLAAGSKSALWSFNHDTGSWEVNGSMTVSDDGSQVCTDPGVGIRAPGWHGSQPGSENETEDTEDEKERDCGEFTLSDGWTVAVAGGKCAAQFAGKVPKLLVAAYDAFDAGWKLGEAMGTAIDQYETGEWDTTALKQFVDSLKTLKGSIKGAVEALAENNPFDQVVAAFKCFEEFFKAATDITCRALGNCDSDLIDGICELTNNIKGLLFFLIDNADKWGDAVKDAPFLALCAAFETLVATLAAPPAEEGLDAVPDPVILADLREIKELTDQATTMTRDQALVGVPAMREFFAGLGRLVTAHNILITVRDGYSDVPYRLDVGAATTFGRTTAQGRIQERVGANTDYRLEVLALRDNALAISEGTTPPDGVRAPFAPRYVIDLTEELDGDGDGLADVAERVVGTSISNPDTDSDGVRDGAEVLNGTDPLDGLPGRTGLIASADTPGSAVDVAARNDLAVVGDSGDGIAVFNVFNGMNPRDRGLRSRPRATLNPGAWPCLGSQRRRR